MLVLLFGHKRRRPENSGAQYEVADFGPESEVESIAMAAKVKFFFFCLFLEEKKKALCYCLLEVIEETGRDGTRGEAGWVLKLWLLCLCFMLCLWVYRMVGGGKLFGPREFSERRLHEGFIVLQSIVK